MARGRNIAQDIALQRAKYPHLNDEEFRFMLQQIAGRERLCEKLPTLVAQADWWFPASLACEQCSSEQTAWYKVQCVQAISAKFDCFVDLTGGYGVDSYFLSSLAKAGHYVEKDEGLCQIAAHNFAHTRPHITIHHTTAEEYLGEMEQIPSSTLLYIDPARRGTGGAKVFRLEDCIPNVVTLLPQLLSKSSRLLIKLSPMLDISAALRALNEPFDVHVVAVHNEVKELLLVSKQEQTPPLITAVNIAGTIAAPRVQRLCFTYNDEHKAEVQYLSPETMPCYLYEPNAAITKACAFRYMSAHFRLEKLSSNTHLYASAIRVPDFPGRVWKVAQTLSARDTKRNLLSILAAKDHTKGCAIVTRNYPMSAEQLRHKLCIPDGDIWYVIGARVGDKPILYLAERLQ